MAPELAAAAAVAAPTLTVAAALLSVVVSAELASETAAAAAGAGAVSMADGVVSCALEVGAVGRSSSSGSSDYRRGFLAPARVV